VEDNPLEVGAIIVEKGYALTLTLSQRERGFVE
jgi:hypothetical protein